MQNDWPIIYSKTNSSINATLIEKDLLSWNSTYKKLFLLAPKTGWKSQHPWNSNRRNQYQNIPRPTANNNEHLGYQQPSSWRPPMDYYSQMGWPPQSAYQNWPRPFGQQTRSYGPPQSYQGSSNHHHQPAMNIPWQHPPPHVNLWNFPPPPPPPNL